MIRVSDQFTRTDLVTDSYSPRAYIYYSYGLFEVSVALKVLELKFLLQVSIA